MVDDDYVTVYGNDSINSDDESIPVSNDVIFMSVERWTSGIVLIVIFYDTNIITSFYSGSDSVQLIRSSNYGGLEIMLLDKIIE